MKFNISTALLTIILGLFIQVSIVKHDNVSCKIARTTMSESEPGGGWLPPPPPPTQL